MIYSIWYLVDWLQVVVRHSSCVICNLEEIQLAIFSVHARIWHTLCALFLKDNSMERGSKESTTCEWERIKALAFKLARSVLQYSAAIGRWAAPYTRVDGDAANWFLLLKKASQEHVVARTRMITASPNIAVHTPVITDEIISRTIILLDLYQLTLLGWAKDTFGHTPC